MLCMAPAVLLQQGGCERLVRGVRRPSRALGVDVGRIRELAARVAAAAKELPHDGDVEQAEADLQAKARTRRRTMITAA